MTYRGQATTKKFPKNDVNLEAFRGLNSFFSPNRSDDLYNNQDSYFQERKELERRLKRAEMIRKQERVIFSNQERQIKTQVQALQEELKKLTTSVQTLSEQVKIAAVQAPVDAGVYHVSFFEKLISLVKMLTKQVENASTWLGEAQAKSKKRSYYWSHVRKSGSKFMLSQERYMATQAG